MSRSLITTILNIFGTYSSKPQALTSTHLAANLENTRMSQIVIYKWNAGHQLDLWSRRKDIYFQAGRKNSCSFLSRLRKTCFALSYICKQNWIWEKKTYSTRHNYPRLPRCSLSPAIVWKRGSKRLVETEKHVFLWKSIRRNIYQLLAKHTKNNILFLKARNK